MKKNILFFILISSIFANAQFSSDLVVFNPEGNEFELFLGQKKVNILAAAKVRANDILPGEYFITVNFRNINFERISQRIFIPGNTEVAVILRTNSMGQCFVEIVDVLDYTQLRGNQTDRIPNVPVVPNDASNCLYPMDNPTFDVAIETVSNQNFDNYKLETAKQIVASNCLYAVQIKAIMKLFSYDSYKLKFAKFAYLHCYDKNRYFIVNDAFDFSSSVASLVNYIDGLK